ncbi:MAG TPA: alanine--tRNA ligase [Vicinamibacterales bacterium]|jgi:alanyl-tRNA synthetase|nr:alanine--tRNA ligase [Vicinamibacterales bacterium]
MTGNEIRLSFLKYFERNGHRIVPSSPLVPHNDPTLLFTNAGMNQFKDVFLGKEKRDYTRATTAQKCMRVSGKHNDLDNVGPSFRHHTFFEMLGNFSFGDYFKRDAIPFAWHMLTAEWQLPAERLWPTVFHGDAAIPRDGEAYDVWRKFVPVERIGELGQADNFWQMGDTGPCGRCSEIYYFRGSQIPCVEETAGGACRGLECSCDRFVEIWNNVFMEFDRQADGKLNPLPAPSIDTGMGLERVTAVIEGHLSNYDTDLFTPLLKAIGERAGTTHRGTMAASDISMRVVADHMRAMTFLIGDGVVPSNEWRGYVLRKIMRRAMRHGKRLGVTEPFLHTLVDVIVREFGDAYPELKTGQSAIVQVIRSEEERFDAVLTDGLPRLEEVLDKTAAGTKVVRGEAAFRLYDTYGLPRDFIEDMIEERKLAFDREGFETAMEQQREKARAKSKFKTDARGGEAFAGFDSVPATTFTGYDSTTAKTRVIALARLKDGAAPVEVQKLSSGDAGWIVLEETPFYVQSGGQISDVGTLRNDFGFVASVSDVELVGAGVRAHRARVHSGEIAIGAPVMAEIDAGRRAAIRRNHTATHLLHAALRQVLGPHVKQAGSLVAPDRLRFDFVHFSALTTEQLRNIEQIVNKHILRNTHVETVVKPTQEAIAAGAMALFGEKYGDKVRVVSVAGVSMELCGGTHVHATGDIGLFAIVSEGGVAAGTRRIEAITGTESLKLFEVNREIVHSLGQLVNARPEELAAKVNTLQDETKRLARELQQAKMKAAMGGGSGAQEDAIDVAGVKLIAREVSGLDKDALRALVDQHRDRIKSGVVVLAAPSDGKVSIVVGVTPDLTKKVPAGQVVKQLAPIVGGGGGGRPDFAEAGGKDPAKIGEMLAAARDVITKLLG